MNTHIQYGCHLFALLLALGLGSNAMAQQPERWFQIELSVFSNENPSDREAELWQSEGTQLRYPPRMRRLQELLDLLMIPELQMPSQVGAADSSLPELAAPTLEDHIRATGPFPRSPVNDFRFIDFNRDPFVQLLPATSNFQQTNRAIDRAPDHRLLFHGLWRQPVVTADRATPIYVQGGQKYGDQYELQGSIAIRFNANADRVVIDTNLWLSEFSIVGDPDNEWRLPPVPTGLRRDFENPVSDIGLDYQARRVYHLQQSRDMRSTEFHYLDHPALGLVIMVQPYEVPPVPIQSFDSN